MENKHKKIAVGSGVVACLAVTSMLYFQHKASRSLGDEALLSIIKNDQKSFEKFITAGGSLGTNLSVEGGEFLVGELVVKYERTGFVKFIKSKKMSFVTDPKKAFDVYSLAVSKNNPDLLSLLIDEKSRLAQKTYGEKKWNLLHLASSECAFKVVPVLHRSGVQWNTKAQDGTTALTVAAEAGCLQALSYWKDQGANFNEADGRGKSALSILNKAKDAATMAFAESFAPKRVPASVATVAVAKAKPAEPNFYKKRVIPKDNLANRADLIEPSDRPDEANETADYSEFSD